jgi:hypothetical protein
MMNRNDYQIRLFNGDIGVAWEDSQRTHSGQAPLGVMFPSESGGMRRILPSRLPEHETVYAMTVHKAPGVGVRSRLVDTSRPGFASTDARDAVYRRDAGPKTRGDLGSAGNH